MRKYGNSVNKLLQFSGKVNDQFYPDLNGFIEFLFHELQGKVPEVKSLGYSAKSSVRSVISAIVRIDNMPEGQHPIVYQFMKSVFTKEGLMA